MKNNKVRILVVDIETSPLITYTWGMFDQNIQLNQIVEDWHILSFAAKFLGEDKMYYADQRKSRDISNDKPLLKQLWKLMDEADIIIGQNAQAFDIKKINARFIIHGMNPPSSYKVIDTLKISKKHFAMTSNRLEYLSKKLCTKKKSDHKRFSGFELWKECLKGNQDAWKEMEHYNKQDVLSTEELYLKLQPWDNSFNPNLYNDDNSVSCACGSTSIHKKGFAYTSIGKYQRYICSKCGAQSRGSINLLSVEKRKTLRRGIK